MKLVRAVSPKEVSEVSSIHPQGWVPIETGWVCIQHPKPSKVAFTPKGGCPLKLLSLCLTGGENIFQVAFTPKGGCPLKRSSGI